MFKVPALSVTPPEKLLDPERVNSPPPATVMPPLLTLAEISRSGPARPLLMLKVLVKPPRLTLPEMEDESGLLCVVSVNPAADPSVTVPTPVVMVPPFNVTLWLPIAPRVAFLPFRSKVAPLLITMASAAMLPTAPNFKVPESIVITPVGL